MLWWENLYERGNLEDTGADEKTLIKWILKEIEWEAVD